MIRSYFIQTIWFAVCGCAYIGLLPVASAQTEDKEASDFIRSGREGEFEWMVDEVRKSQRSGLITPELSGCLLVAVRGEVVLVQSFGPEKQPTVTPRSLFEIASVTKPFTATAAQILAERGKLDLDSSIDQWLPAVPTSSKRITVRHLMEHRSGIPGDSYGNPTIGFEAAVASMLGDGPRHEPGSHFEYWNQGYVLLSQIISKAAGVSFEEFVRQEIFLPCGMKGSCFVTDTEPSGYSMTVGKGKLGPSRTCLEHPYGGIQLSYSGTGGLVSNVWDLWRFHRSLSDGKLLAQKSREETLDAPAFPYGLGWFVDRYQGETVLRHSGKVRGFTGAFRRYLNQDACIVFLCNRDDQFLDPIVELFESQFLTLEQKYGLTDAYIESICGNYRGEIKSLKIERGRTSVMLKLTWFDGGPVSQGTIRRIGNDTFLVLEGQSRALKTTESSDGKIKTLEIPDFPEVFKRLENDPR